MTLTPKQEAFAQAYVKTSNQTEAYRHAYDPKKATPNSLNRMAKAVYDNVKVASRIEQLRQQLAKRNATTVDDLVKELQQARKIAKEIKNPSAMVNATMGKAKLLGLDNATPGGEEESPPMEIHFHVDSAKGEVKTTNAKP